jgi:two-component system chemotaxis sensor kinase CheA
MQVVVYAEGERRVGLVVERIQDIVEEAVAAPAGGAAPTTAVIQQRVTDLLDVRRVVREACPDVFEPLPYPAYAA